MEWVNLVEYNYNTYPKEGYDVIVSDGIHYDIAWYLMSSTYKWMKNDLYKDDCNEFNQFKIIKWCYIS